MSNRHDYSTLFYLNPFPNWVYDIDTFEILDVNQAAIDLYGYSKEEFLTLTIKELRPKEEIPKVIAVHEGIKTHKGNKHYGTFTHQKKDGTIFRVETNGHRVEFQGRNCFMVVCQDVTILQKQLLELQESEKKLKAASEIAKIGYWKLDLLTNLLFWSDKVFQIWDIKNEDIEISYDFFFNSIHVDDRALFEREQEAALSGLKELNFAHRIILPNGDIKWVHEMGRLNKNQEGKPITFEGTVQDITLQKKEEQYLKLLESVIIHTNDAVLITEAEPQDEPGPKIIYVNEAFTRMTGYTADEVVGKSPRILQGPKSDKDELARLGKALRNWESCEVTTLNYKKNGEEFWINFTVSPVADEKGWYTHWIAIERDVTAAKNEQFKKDFLANISAAFNDGIDINMSLERLSELIASYGDFSLCEIWLPSIHQKTLKLSSRVEMDATAKKFYTHEENTEEIGFDKGLPGKVWKSKESIIWGDIDIKEFFIRNNAAQKSGLKSVLGIPLTHQEKIVGVMVIGTKEDVGKMERYQSVLTEMESFIGSEINRKRLESDLHHLFDTLPDIICIADLNGHFLKINKAGCKLLGYEEHEIVGHPFEKFTHPLDKAIYINEIKIGETILNFENRYITKKNDIIWLSWHCNSFKEEGVIYATAKNITEEKKLRELVADASQLAKIGSWELDLLSHDETNTLYWSSMVRKIMEVDDHYNPSVTGGREFYKAESKKLIEKVGEALIKEGAEFDEELQIITHTGKEKWIRIIAKSEHVNGVCTKIFGSIQDIHAMKTTEVQLKEILGSISDAFLALDEHWNFTYFNKEAENLINRKSSEVLGKNLWEELPYIKGTELERVYHKVAKSRKPETFEYLSPKSATWVEINMYPSAGGISVYFKNIDERKNTAEELQKAYNEKNQILESIGDAFFALDKDWTVTYWNKEAEQVLGRKRDEILGKNLWEVYADAIDSDFYRQYHQAVATGKTVSFEEHYPTINKWFEVTAYPSSKGLSVYFKDVTLRKETDIRIFQANERFEKVTKATTDAIWDWDIENDAFYRGDGFEKLFGYEVKRTLKGDAFWKDSFHPKDLPGIQASLHECLQDASKELWRHEYRIIHKSGQEKTVIDKGVVIRNEKGKAIRMVGAITDITHRVTYEKEVFELNKTLKKHVKELEISNEELEQFAFIASHDLQEPLRMISSFLNQIQRKYGDQLDDKAHQYIHFAIDGAKRMKQIILDLLDYSKAGKLADNLELINLNELIEEYGILRRRFIQEKKATIVINYLPNVTCYKAPLVQTLHCLLDNAIKYSRENIPPVIKISALETEAYWQISIEDNGIGIDAQFFDKIFIIFQRLHNRDRYEGTGIGLSIAKKHVEYWGGKIWVESELEKGSVFYFTIDKNIDI